MKAILEFALPEESEEHRVALEGGKAASALSQMDEWLRGKAKYEGGDITAAQAREELRAILDSLSLEI